jgi:endonuclease/exonuclease/phosphatase family metal-dependent hydrolase
VRIIKYLLLICNTTIAVLITLAYLAPYIEPDQNWMPGIISLFFPYLYMSLLFFVVIWLLSKTPLWSLLSVLVMLPGIPHIQRYYSFWHSPELKQENEIMVISYNLQELQVTQGHNKQKKELLYKEIATHLNQFGIPDLMFVQDYTDKNEEFFKDYMNYKYKHIFSKQRVKTGIFSKYAFKDKGEIRFEKSYNSCIWADIEIKGTVFRVYSIHLESNKISDETEDMLANEEITEEVLRQKFRTMLRKYKSSASLRSRQSAIIAAHVEESPHPVILGGDLNDIPMSRAYRVIKGDLQDVFQKKGKGFGTTYAGGIPGLRIDYIFASNTLEVLENKILKDQAFSDHYAVMARIGLQQK